MPPSTARLCLPLLLTFALGCATTTASKTDSAPAGPSTPESHRAACEELMAEMNMAVSYSEVVESATESQLQMNPQLEPFADVMRDFLVKHLGWDSIRDELIDVYVDAFTETEIRELTAFYRTPIGKKTARLMPDLAARGMKIGERKVEEYKAELGRLIRERAEELEQEKRDAEQGPEPH